MKFSVPNAFEHLFSYCQKVNATLIPKLSIVKKTSVFILSFTVFQVSAKSQNYITLSETNSSVNKILNEIKKQSGYKLLYSNANVEHIKPISVDLKNASLEEALKSTFNGLHLSYMLKNNTILITSKQNTENQSRANINVQGKILDENKKPLPGASVKVKGVNKGAVTDGNGNFSLTAVDNNAILVVSYIGYTTKEVKAATNLTISLSPDNNTDLNDVVVIGYGTQKRTEVTGSITNVKGGDVAAQPIASFDAALGGRAAGVNIVANGGNLNQAPVFRIRGTNSLTLSSYPLIVIDGVPSFTTDNDAGSGGVENNPLSSINPNDIESIDIAKDAAATSIYGSRAANGVVFITTKKGKSGKAKVNISSNVTINKAANLPDLLNAAQYLELKNEGLRNQGTYNATTNFYDYSLDAQGNRIDTRWYDYIYQTGVGTNNNFNISGATDNTKYYGSISVTDQNGIFQKTNLGKKTALFNVENKTTSYLTIGAKINYNNELNSAAMASGSRGNQSASGGMSRLGLINSPIVGPYLNNGTFNTNAQGNLGVMDNASHLSSQARLGFYNPLSSFDSNYNNQKVNNVQSSVFARVNPLKWLALQSTYGIDYRYSTGESYSSPYSGEGIPNGSATSYQNTLERTVWTNTITADQTFNKVHNFSLLLGEEEQTTKGNRFGLNRTGQTDPLYTNIQGGWQNIALSNTADNVNYNYLFSLFSRLQYNFNQKYYATANYRQDEYSALGTFNKKGIFWGFSAGWDIYKEEFWEKSGINKVLNNVKLRASYGKVGNVGGLSDFEALNTYSATLYNGNPALGYSATGNDELHWETSKKTDIGMSFGLFGNKVTGELAYYENNIDGLIFGVPVAPSVGLPNSTNNTIKKNVGSMKNTGVELTLSATPVRNDNFSWNTSFNLTTNKNRVLSLDEGVPSLINGSNDAYTITLPGYSAGMVYAIRTAGVDPTTGRRIFVNGNGQNVLYKHGGTPAWTFEDGSVSPAITLANSGVIYKQSAPKIFGGLSNSFNYKRFELSVMITYQLGGYMLNGTQGTMRDNRFWNNSTDMLRRWQNPGDVTDIPRIVGEDNVSNGNTMPLDINVSSTDFLRLKNVMFSYNVPTNFLSKLKVASAKLYVSGQNLFLLTKYSGLDPEVTTNANNALLQGIDKNQSPNARTFVFGINVGF